MLMKKIQKSIKIPSTNSNTSLSTKPNKSSSNPTSILFILLLSLLNHISQNSSIYQTSKSIHNNLYSGSFHSCQIKKSNNVLSCWGSNDQGQLDSPFLHSSPVVSSLSLGFQHSCAISHSVLKSMLNCWGLNKDYQIDIPDYVENNKVRSVSAGQQHTCVVSSKFKVSCWGGRGQGQGNFGEIINSHVENVQAGIEHTCIIKKDGTNQCVGRGFDASNGEGKDGESNSEIKIVNPYPNIRKFDNVDVKAHFCATARGILVCYNLQSNQRTKLSPELSIETVKVTQSYFTRLNVQNKGFLCLIKISNTLSCKGSNTQGQIDIPSSFKSDTVAVSAGAMHTCAMNQKGIINCWGNHDYQLNQIKDTVQVANGGINYCVLEGIGQTHCNHKFEDIPIGWDQDIEYISSNLQVTCAIKNDSYMKCFGSELIIKDEPQVYSQVLLVSTGYQHACQITTHHKLYCIGSNKHGEKDIPQVLKSSLNVQISAGGQHTCSIRDSIEDKLNCWGDDSDGQVTIPPIQCAIRFGEQINGEEVVCNCIHQISNVKLGYKHTCIVIKESKVYCFGNNHFGQLDVPEQIRQKNGYFDEFQIESMKVEVLKLSCGYNHNCAISRENSLICWGSNSNDALSWPRYFWSKAATVSAGLYNSCATTVDGEWSCWGRGFDNNQSNSND